MCLISIVIPNYNGGKWLPKTLDSCLIQKDFVKEIIIVDDFSTDNSLQILNEYAQLYPGIVKIFCNKEKGGNNARNFGYSQSSGAYIQWLDADDQIFANKFKDQLNSFDSDNSIDIVYSDWWLDTYASDDSLVKREFKKSGPAKDFLYELIIDNWSAPHNYLIKRKFAELLYLQRAWNPDTMVGQDREYFTMAAISGAKFAYVPGFYSVYNRWNKRSVSADVNAKRLESLDKMFERFEDHLAGQKQIKSTSLEKYYNAINTQRALLNVYGYPSKIRRGKLTIKNAEWQIIHGLRTRLKFLLLVLFNKY